MTSIYRAAGAADFLALVPRLMGYRPTRSLVLLPFAGNRTLGAIRFDLPESLEPASLDAVSSTAIGMVCKVARADAVAAVVFADDTAVSDGGLPHAPLVEALRTRADICGLRIVDTLCLAQDGWGSYLDPDLPPGARPLDEIPFEHAAFDALPLTPGDQGAGAALPPVDLAEKERVARALSDLDAATRRLFGSAGGGGGGDAERIAPAALATACVLDDVPLLFESALESDPATLDPYEAAALVWCLDRPLLRDVALVQWARDLHAGDEAFDAQLAWHDGAELPAHLGEAMLGMGPAPDPDRLESGLALARRLAAAAPRSHRAGLLATCGWLAWALGRSTEAGRHAQAALEVDPAHGLAGIVRTVVTNAHLPEWAFARSAPVGAVTHLIDSARVES
jgi:hypothetical protein